MFYSTHFIAFEHKKDLLERKNEILNRLQSPGENRYTVVDFDDRPKETIYVCLSQIPKNVPKSAIVLLVDGYVKTDDYQMYYYTSQEKLNTMTRMETYYPGLVDLLPDTITDLEARVRANADLMKKILADSVSEIIKRLEEIRKLI